MKKTDLIVIAVLALGACVETTSDDEFLRQAYAIGPDSPPTEVILKRFPAISPDKVQVQFGYPSDCANLSDVGLLTGWGRKGQNQQEILQDFRVRAAKYGANLVSFEPGVSSLEQMDEILHTPTEYTLFRCR